MKTLELLLSQNRPLVMGILNTTPDSFSDGGKFLKQGDAIKQIERMLKCGADIIDIGGESTRPGAAEVPEQEEIERVMPLVEAANKMGAVVSVDTSKASVMKEALAQGVELINDVRALQEEGAIEVVANSRAHVCLMHMQGSPRTMQQNPTYEDVTNEVKDMLRQRIAVCTKHGIEAKRIIIDPGFGFGKTLQHNCQLMHLLDELKELECPILVGVSRKRMIGDILDREVDDRIIGSVVAAAYAAQKGAKILRVHDVDETVQAIKIVQAFEKQ
ncbi:dihydropteroate synthase [Kangiella sediminilitoris]|uniref:Dihydropteroate synthase n=1 Tax=Kangiella sediminilitoris TaxID=1144748 RepID=A0A1B3B855_9GAMM|nr:dihydropteroate synthase [Kangiella sediminilitoris]AOE48977.1 dihydropteroate synthase [Kangiella sediminilitoris]